MAVTPVLGGIQFLAIHTSTSGDNALISGVAGRRVIVHHVYIAAASAVGLAFKSSGGTALTGTIPVAAANQPPAWVDDSPAGLFCSAEGEGVTLNIGGAVQVDGYLGFSLA